MCQMCPWCEHYSTRQICDEHKGKFIHYLPSCENFVWFICQGGCVRDCEGVPPFDKGDSQWTSINVNHELWRDEK
jgi:hypothetical protein